MSNREQRLASYLPILLGTTCLTLGLGILGLFVTVSGSLAGILIALPAVSLIVLIFWFDWRISRLSYKKRLAGWGAIAGLSGALALVLCLLLSWFGVIFAAVEVVIFIISSWGFISCYRGV